MKITKLQLKNYIKKVAGKQLLEMKLLESYGIEQYERMLELKSLYEEDFWILDKVGPELYQKILDFRGQAKDFPRFKSMVEGMPAEMAKRFWEEELGTVSTETLMEYKKEYEEYKNRFKEVDATNEADKAYGRKTKKIVDTETGETLGYISNREGSLGT